MQIRRQPPPRSNYLQRIIEQEYVHDQAQNAAKRLQEAYARISREGAGAVEDRKVYEKVREAAISLRRAMGAIEEPPPEPKRWGRKVLLLVFLAAGPVYYAKRRRARAAAMPVDSEDLPPAPQAPQAPDGVVTVDHLSGAESL